MTTAVASLEDKATNKVVFGFWLYVMSDCILFAIMFSAYSVLHNNTFSGVGIQQVASLPYVLVESLFLLTSAFTYGMCYLGMNRNCKKALMSWLVITFVLGLVFLGLEINEFAVLIHSGNSWQRSAFLSSFFLLVGGHGLHIFIGLIWMIILMIQVSSQGLTPMMKTRFTCLGIFWHFLDIVWIFIFTLVYLMGAI